MEEPTDSGLRKELTLFDVYAISTGAMFSSGFFLLPGLAAAQAGPAVVLAYLLASLFILPAMFSMAELATAMPRAGGAYYFLDRSLGPIMGTIGGLGTWLALVLKSAFALVGMGAYLAIYMEVPVKPLAVALTLVFMAVNIFGAKETSGLQRILVTVLVGILGFFILQGLFEVLAMGVGRVFREQFTPFLPFGISGLIGTIGFVFVSYAGLTKVASISEEVQDPERNIPLGMMLSLATTTFVYVVGVFIMVAVLDAQALRSDLTPVATAAEAFFDWLPPGVGLALIIIAAIAAFASTGNAGIMSASRYPLAMARDRLVWEGFGVVGRFGTPVPAIVWTAALMILMIVTFDIEGIAKLASAFQLLLFSLLSFAVIVMRESRIEAYDPGYRSPLYPWMQIAGMIAPLWLIAEMGELAILFTLGLVAACIAWYFYYARERVEREGAILHTFAKWGERRFHGLDLELRGILKEKGLRTADPFDEVVARADFLELDRRADFGRAVDEAAGLLARRLGLPRAQLARGFLAGTRRGATPVAHGAALPHMRLPGIEHPELVLVRSRSGVPVSEPAGVFTDEGPPESVHALFFLVSPEDNAGQHLRFLAEIATQTDRREFLEQWLAAEGSHEAKELLLRDDYSLSVAVTPGGPFGSWAGREIRGLDLPGGTLIAVIGRGEQSLVPSGSTVLEAGDRVIILGEPGQLAGLRGSGSVEGREPD